MTSMVDNHANRRSCHQGRPKIDLIFLVLQYIVQPTLFLYTFFFQFFLFSFTLFFLLFFSPFSFFLSFFLLFFIYAILIVFLFASIYSLRVFVSIFSFSFFLFFSFLFLFSIASLCFSLSILVNIVGISYPVGLLSLCSCYFSARCCFRFSFQTALVFISKLFSIVITSLLSVPAQSPPTSSHSLCRWLDTGVSH